MKKNIKDESFTREVYGRDEEYSGVRDKQFNGKRFPENMKQVVRSIDSCLNGSYRKLHTHKIGNCDDSNHQIVDDMLFEEDSGGESRSDAGRSKNEKLKTCQRCHSTFCLDQQIAWPVHSFFCLKLPFPSKLETARRSVYGVYMPIDASTGPELVEIPIDLEYEHKLNDSVQRARLEFIFGNETLDRRIVSNRSKTIDRVTESNSVLIFIRKKNRKVEKTNQTVRLIQNEVRGCSEGVVDEWRGPVLIMKRDTQSLTHLNYVDIKTGDFVDIVDFFRSN